MNIPYELLDYRTQAAFRLLSRYLHFVKNSGNEIIFEHPFEESSGREAFRFNIPKGRFFDMHRAGNEMCFTPAQLLARFQKVSPYLAHKLIDLAMKQLPSPILARQTSAKSNGNVSFDRSQSFETMYHSNLAFRKRSEIITRIIQWLFDHPRDFEHGSAAFEFAKRRGFSLSNIGFENDFSEILNSEADLEEAAASLQLSVEEKLLSTFWQLDDDKRVYMPWIPDGFWMLFYACLPVVEDGFVSWRVSGVRVRQVLPVTTGPKEVALSTSSLNSLRGTPSVMGFFGNPNELVCESDVPREELFGHGSGQCIVLTEGCTDLMAAKTLLAKEGNGHPNVRTTTVISTGQIHSAFWPSNLDLIRNCDRLIIAFNNDSSKSVNTGQENADRLRKLCIERGFKRVEILPTSTLDGCNDINDLLRLRYPSPEIPNSVSAFTSFVMED